MSIVTNPALMSALSLLRAAQSDHQKVLTDISGGRQVSSASDNAAYWAISQMMGSHGSAIAASQDTVAMSQAMADTATAGLKTAGGIVSEIRSKLLLAASQSHGRSAINEEIDQLKDQLKSLSGASSFTGENWLQSDIGATPSVKSLVSGITDGPEGPGVQTIDVDTTATNLVALGDANDGILTRATNVTSRSGTPMTFHLLDAGSATPPQNSTEIAVSDTTTMDQFTGMVSALDKMMGSITDASAKTGATASRLSSQDQYLAHLQDTLQQGMGNLIDTNMEEGFVKLKATELQTKLQVVVVNMVNENSKTLLDLFK